MKKTKDFNSKMHVGAGLVSAQKGITLIALIITIIVMLILVSVTISMAVNGGLFEYAGKSVSDTEKAINKEQELAGGQVQIDGEWYDSIDDFLAGVESIKSLQEKHEFKYYSSLVKAVVDVNNNTRENADADKENAVAGIYTENGKHTVVLLKDTTEEARVEPKVDMTINLGGNTLVSSSNVGIDIYSGNITIDGRLSGSTIKTENNSWAYTIQIRPGSSNVTVSGGNYISVSVGEKSVGVNNHAKLTMVNCSIKAYSNYHDRVIDSKGISNSRTGILTLKECCVMGVQVAVFNAGSLSVNRGTYEGVVYGGFWFEISGGTAYVRNAATRECEMPEGYTSTIESKKTGLYLDKNCSNMKVYMDNCDIYGSANPMIVEGTNNILYISNSRINTDKQINFGTSNKLYIGKGNNFTAENTNNPTAVVKTEEVYVQE